MIKVLNLYAGIGGNRKLWEDVAVTAVELDESIAAVYQKHFPNDTVIIGDAHQYLLDHYKNFDFIWSSPPCPTHSKMNNALKGIGVIRYPDMALYQEIILLQHFSECPWVVENVASYYSPLVEPVNILRHFFWSNFTIRHTDLQDPTTGTIGHRKKQREFLQECLGFNLDGSEIKDKRKALRNCVLPELGKHIFDCAMGYKIKSKQRELFA